MINYFDLGLYTGSEMKWMLDIFFSLKISDFFAFGFEPDPNNLKRIHSKLLKTSKVKIIPKAIAPLNGKVKLYKCVDGSSGNSLFKTKHNVGKTFSVVDGIIFSEWIADNVPSFKTDFNIIRTNMEGSEYHFFRDIIKNNIHKHVNIFCGAAPGKDIKKIKELEDKVCGFLKMLSDNNIRIYQFADQKEKIFKLKKIIKNKLGEYYENN